MHAARAVLSEPVDSFFLSPSPRRLLPMALSFAAVQHWCGVVTNNLLAEFWHVYREGPKDGTHTASVLDAKTLCLAGPESEVPPQPMSLGPIAAAPVSAQDGWLMHLVKIGASLHIVSGQVGGGVCEGGAGDPNGGYCRCEPRLGRCGSR